MKSMKIASAAMLAMVGLGFAASPASAATESTATVDIIHATGLDRTLTLLEVPTNYEFEATAKANGVYTNIEAKEKLGSGTATYIGKVKVHRNYQFRKGLDQKDIPVKKVQAKLTSLTYGTNNTPVTELTNFSIDNHTLTGTSVSFDLYKDTEIIGTVTQGGKTVKNQYEKKVEGAKISFTETAVEPGDQLTGTITYTVTNA